MLLMLLTKDVRLLSKILYSINDLHLYYISFGTLSQREFSSVLDLT